MIFRGELAGLCPVLGSAVHRVSWNLPDGSHLYCDVSLPVPLDQPFTYAMPETLRHRVKAGCRVLVPFGSRRLTGVTLRCHDDAPGVPTREALRLIDAEPVLDAELLALGNGSPAITARR